MTNHFIKVADVDAKFPSLAFLSAARLNLHQVVAQVHLTILWKYIGFLNVVFSLASGFLFDIALISWFGKI